MHAMQYEITLPADYDMDVIRRRVESRGTMTDDFRGLGLKAYGIRERGVDGSPVNQYAPFYLWLTVEGINTFLWGPGFRGLCDSFGRPVVQHWTGVAFERGPARAATPRAASRHTTQLPPDADLAAAIEDATAELHERAQLPDVHSTALVVDPRRWEVVQFTLWRDDAPKTTGTRYRVLHLSTPHLNELPVGRHW